MNWEAQTWEDVTNIQNMTIFEPSLTSKISDMSLQEIKETPHIFPRFPLHSTSVERAVKLVTEAASQVYGEKKRHERILSVLEARKVMPSFESKAHFKLNI